MLIDAFFFYLENNRIRSTFVFLEQELVHPVQVSENLDGRETDLHLVLLQMQKLTNYIQSWLIESENPLVELYRYLRRFNSPTCPFSSSLTFLSYRLLLPIITLACSLRTGTNQAGNFERTIPWSIFRFRLIGYGIEVLNKSIYISRVTFHVKVSMWNTGKNVISLRTWLSHRRNQRATRKVEVDCWFGCWMRVFMAVDRYRHGHCLWWWRQISNQPLATISCGR